MSNHNKNNKFCLSPFFNLMVMADGQYTPCCRYHGRLHHNGKKLLAPTDSFDLAWNCDDMQKLRQDFLDGKTPVECRDCWEEESAGIKSLRLQSFDYNLSPELKIIIKQPLKVDLYPGNLCNLRCRICSGQLSTSLIKEHQQVFNETLSHHNNINKNNYNTLLNWLPNIVELGLFGGEPFISKEIIALINFLVKSRQSTHIRLLINTNCTVFNRNLAKNLQYFKKVYLNFSLDDIGPRLEYQRKGIQWKKAKEVIRNFLKYGGTAWTDKVECKICYTVNIFNIYYLPDYLKTIKNEFGDIQIYFNFLHNPNYYCISCFPEFFKQLLCKRLELQAKPIYSPRGKDTRTIDDIINFCIQPSTQSFAKTQQWITKIDSLRQESFAKVFPEAWSLLNKKD